VRYPLQPFANRTLTHPWWRNHHQAAIGGGFQMDVACHPGPGLNLVLYDLVEMHDVAGSVHGGLTCHSFSVLMWRKVINFQSDSIFE
jgi:hypothetical protein